MRLARLSAMEVILGGIAFRITGTRAVRRV